MKAGSTLLLGLAKSKGYGAKPRSVKECNVQERRVVSSAAGPVAVRLRIKHEGRLHVRAAVRDTKSRLNTTSAQLWTYSADQSAAKLTPKPEGKDAEIEVKVKTLTGKVVKVVLDANATVLELKQKVQDSEGVPVEAQRIITKGLQLDNKNKLSSRACGPVVNGTTVHLVVRLSHSQASSKRALTLTEVPREVDGGNKRTTYS